VLERRKLVEIYKKKIRDKIKILEDEIYELDTKLRTVDVINIIDRIL
jgi:hypothetical protein